MKLSKHLVTCSHEVGEFLFNVGIDEELFAMKVCCTAEHLLEIARDVFV